MKSKPLQIVWSPLALKRVEEASRYIAKDKPLAARSWVEDIFKSVKRLEKYPKSGRILPETANPLIREIIRNSYRIIYQINPNSIAILTLRHQRQTLKPKSGSWE